MPIRVTELDPPARDAFEPFAMRVEIASLEELRALKAAVGTVPSAPTGVLQGMFDFLKAKLARYERVS